MGEGTQRPRGSTPRRPCATLFSVRYAAGLDLALAPDMQRGFGIVDTFFAIGVLGILVTFGVPNFLHFRKKAQRQDAVLVLNSIRRAQYAYYADRNEFAASLDVLQFSVDPGTRLDANTWFSDPYTYQCDQPNGTDSFSCTASANLDSDPFLDQLLVEVGT
jgi:type II secretory pathway pseudopilin PulG